MAPESVAQLVSEARNRIENLSVDDVAAEVMNEGVVLVDIREPEERLAMGTIPGSIHAARGMLEFYADSASPYHRPDFDPTRRTILFCASGGRSALATETIRRLGFTRAAHLDGGLKAWTAAGKPIESI